MKVIHPMPLVLRRWRFVLVTMSVTLLVMQLLLYSNSHQVSRISSRVFSLTERSKHNEVYLVDTVGCKIPNLDPFDKSILRLVHRGRPMHCSGRFPPLTHADGNTVKVNKTALSLVQTMYPEQAGFHCEYQAIIRKTLEDEHGYIFSSTVVTFKDEIEIFVEFIRVKCFRGTELVHINFYAFVQAETRSREQLQDKKFKQHVEHNKVKEHLNVIMLGADSVSRLNHIRQLPKTRKFLREKLKAVEMLGYNKVADNTMVNLVPMFSGKFINELPWSEDQRHEPFDKYPFAWKTFSAAGYRTLYAEDAPKIATFNFGKGGFVAPPGDAYLRPFSLAMEAEPMVWDKIHHCVGDRLETTIVLDYMTDFVNLYKKKPYFAFSFISRLTHDGFNKAQASDEPHFQFLQRLQWSGVLGNSVLIYFSDHGMRFGPIRSYYIGKLEERLPFMFIALPPWFSQKYPQIAKNLETNSQRLTTPFDVYETLMDILHFSGDVSRSSKSWGLIKGRGVGLFREISENRTCESADILPHWCTCQKKIKISVSDDKVTRAVESTVKYMNRLLVDHFNLCHNLSLFEIHDAYKSDANENFLHFKESINDVINRQVIYANRTESVVHYLVTLETQPGNAIFEATVRHHEMSHSFAVVGDISRINRYGEQSACIDIPTLKKVCYCK